MDDNLQTSVAVTKGAGVLDGRVALRVALAGQPNVGKSTVFNLLTGLSQHVGNWPGKTVEQKTGIHHHGDITLHVVDLPGTYSLTANSLEEVIARDYIVRERPDVVVTVVNAASLERHLYLVAELLPLANRLVVALNMVDVAASEGMQVEARVLEAALGVPVVSMSASKNQGVSELVETVVALVRGELPYTPCIPEIREDHRQVLDEVLALLDGCVPDLYPPDWVALKLLEGDTEITALLREQILPADRWAAIHEILMAHEDAVLSVASGRYEWVGRMVRAAVTRPRAGQITLTERLDRWATHPIWGLGILAAILGLVFGLTFAVGTPLQDLLERTVVGGLSSAASGLLANAPTWLRSLVVDGAIGGVGTVVTFLPILVIFFAVLALLEDVGYMGRAAFVMDRFMHLVGLHGKSFMPLFLGFGCNVPAVAGSRIIDSPRARLLTILLAPLVPCAARMAVIVFVAPVFFGAAAALVAWGLVALSLAVLVLVGILLNRWVLRGERAAFIMELPLYHLPNARTIGIQVWQNSREFLKRAGTLILVMSIVVWALSVLPDGQLETSYLAAAGRALEPLGALMGLDWRMLVALLTSFVAKENAIATMGVLFAGGEAAGTAGLQTALAGALTPAGALAFLVVQILFIPCVATVAAMRQETRSWGWTGLGVGLLLVISLVGGIVAYQAANLI
ncbi:MAG: ferrous iron transport protein B [Anaerolineae bacterium]|jgi:ferrous iron transport protein B|nr:ferrous iron transport protein B [Anaerolineae bacterium]MDX9829996.1 ferrous iron transport protein B [Anaerolineae bacterium]